MDPSELSSSEAELVEKLKAEVAAVVNADPALRYFCNYHTYVRYLRARQWNLQKASKMLHATLAWRQTYKPHEIRLDDLAQENDTGKIYLYPHSDREGRPVLLLRPRLENTKDNDLQLKNTVYHLELASRLADERGVGKMTWFVDYCGYSMRNAPPLKLTMATLNTLQNHYPERLGCAISYNPPTLFAMTYKAISPFIDPITVKKLVFVTTSEKDKHSIEERIDLELLEDCVGGKIKGSVFDKDAYAEERRAADAANAAAIAALAGAHAGLTHAPVGDSAASLTQLVSKVQLGDERGGVAVTADSA